MDLHGHPVNFCLFCLNQILPYIVVPQSEAAGDEGNNVGEMEGDETSDSILLVTPIIPNFKRLCSYLGIKFPSERELFNDRQSIVGGGQSIFSATCDKFLCLTCFERVDYLRLLYNQMEDIRGKIKNAAQVIKDFVVEKTNVVGTSISSVSEGSSSVPVLQLEFIKVLENHVKQVSALSSIWRGSVGVENLEFLVDRDELHVRDGTVESGSGECSSIPKIETTINKSDKTNLVKFNSDKNESSPSNEEDDEEEKCNLMDNLNPRKTVNTIDCAGKNTLKSVVEIQVDGRKMFQCSHCMKPYERIKSLRNHIVRTHSSTLASTTEGVPCLFTCHLCDSSAEDSGQVRRKRKYGSEESLKKHIFFKHTTGPKYKCEQCFKRYYSNQQLNNHVNTEHKGIRHPCSMCSKQFTNKSHLKRHEKLNHTRQGLYECSVCLKSFSLPGELKRHMIFHDDNATKDHICEMCGKNFLTKSQLTSHAYNTHQTDRSKRFQCLQCPAKFKGRLQLEYHSSTHSGDKPFKCPFCQRGFAQKSQVNKHVKVIHEQAPKRKGRQSKTSDTVEAESNINNHSK